MLFRSVSRVQKYAGEPRSPRIVLLNEDMPNEKLAMLYRAADVLVHPYRAEGFGLPLLESMAYGTPVITTDAGPAPEFCPRDASMFVPASVEEIPDDPPPLGRLSAPFTWFEPNMQALVQALREAYENPYRLREMGERAAKHAHGSRAWPVLAPDLNNLLENCLQAAGVEKLHGVGA